MRNLANFHQNTWNCQNWYFHGTLLSKVQNTWATNLQRSYNDTEEWWKIWRGIDLSFQNWHKEFDKFWLENSKVSKVYTLMGSFWPKCIMFELKKNRRVIFHDIRVWYTWHLKKSWLVVWKIVWGIWQILSSAYESLTIGTFIGSFYTK